MSTEAKIRIAIGALLASLFVFTGLSWWSVRQFVASSQWVEHTLTVENEIGSLLASATELESEGRSYAMVATPEARQAVDRAAAAAYDHLAKIEALTADNPEQQRRTAALRPVLDAKVAFGRRVFAARDTSGVEAAGALMAAGEGRREMLDIRRILTDMAATEDALHRVRSGKAEADAKRAFGASVATTAAVAAAAVTFYFLVRAELRARRHAFDAIADSEQRFRLLVDGVRDYGIYMLDPGGHVTSWNAGAERMTGYRAPEVLGRHISVFYEKADVDEGRPERELRLAAETGRYEEERRRVRKDGSVFWANVILTALRDEHGQLQGFAKVTGDITERKEADLALRAFADRLERSNRELQEFAMIASHDLQEPLRKVQMFGDRLREEYEGALGATGKDYLERMQKAAARGQALIQGLLAYSRITTKAQPPARVDLHSVATEVVSDLEGRIAQVGGTVDVGALPEVEADGLQMRQLLQNLIGNALKFHKDGAAPHVRVHELPNGPDNVRFAVEDDGIGFDEKYLDRIFKLFQRLHERGAYEGAGMGLAICRKIVERHQGEITAHSAPGKGATFIVTLPAHAPATGGAS